MNNRYLSAGTAALLALAGCTSTKPAAVTTALPRR